MTSEDPNDLEISESEISDLVPNFRGLYSLCFHSKCQHPPLNNEDDIRELFSPVAPIADITDYKGLQFVRFSTKELAIKALKAFRTKLQIKVADQKKNSTIESPNSDVRNHIRTNKRTTNKHSHNHSSRNSSDGILMYMGNIDVNSTEEEIQEFLSGIDILECRVFKKKSKCYAFLKVSDQEEAEKSVKLYHSKMFKNRALTLRRFRVFDVQAKPASNSNRPLNKEINNNAKQRKNFANSTPHVNPDYDELKARMPPLENIVSSSDDDDDDNSNESNADIYFERPINGNTRQANMQNFFHLFVGNFPYGTSEVDLLRLFQHYHPTKAIIINGNDKSRSTQGFVCLSNPKDLEAATEEMDRTEYKNQILLVSSSVCCVDRQKPAVHHNSLFGRES